MQRDREIKKEKQHQEANRKADKQTQKLTYGQTDKTELEKRNEKKEQKSPLIYEDDIIKEKKDFLKQILIIFVLGVLIML